jgi:Domain of unknown function (DUF3846)
VKITGILVPQDEEKRIQKVEFESGDIDAMRAYIHGPLEVVNFDNPPTTIWCDEEAKFKDGWRPNRRVTLLLWVHSSAFRGFEVIAGDVLLTGRADKNGDTTSVSDQLLKLLFKLNALRIEVQTEKNGPWDTNGQWYSDWESAYIAAVHLAERWSLVKEVRVVEVEQPSS